MNFSIDLRHTKCNYEIGSTNSLGTTYRRCNYIYNMIETSLKVHTDKNLTFFKCFVGDSSTSVLTYCENVFDCSKIVQQLNYLRLKVEALAKAEVEEQKKAFIN